MVLRGVKLTSVLSLLLRLLLDRCLLSLAGNIRRLLPIGLVLRNLSCLIRLIIATILVSLRLFTLSGPYLASSTNTTTAGSSVFTLYHQSAIRDRYLIYV